MKKMLSLSLPIAPALMLLLALAAGCGDDPAEPPAPPPFVIAGSVTDANGDPVAGAPVLLDLDMEPVGKAAGMPPSTAIRIALAEASAVSFSILDACHEDTLHHQDLELEGGVHTMVWNGTDRDGRELTDRCMWVILATADTTTERSLVLLRNVGDEGGDFADWDHDHVLDHVRAQAITDQDGWFRIVRPCLGLGTIFPLIDEEGTAVGEARITYRVRAWAYRPDHPPASSAWRELDPETGGTVSVILDD